jgi:hypothetical protein
MIADIKRALGQLWLWEPVAGAVAVLVPISVQALIAAVR